MHMFALELGSVLNHSWARKLVCKSQKIVTYVQASHAPHKLVTEARKAQKLKGGGLKSSNTTRLTSVVECLESLVTNMRPLQTVVEQHPGAQWSGLGLASTHTCVPCHCH